MFHHSSRRQILRIALASTGFGLAVGPPSLTLAQSASPTPQCNDGDDATIRQTEGPYFKPSSPQRANLVEPDTKGRLVEINGQVLTRSCRPVGRALIDLWHADERGEYDNAGFRYRGHLFTDSEGRYRFHTIPACALSWPHPALSYQGAGPGAAGAYHSALFSRRARQPARWAIPARVGDANNGSPGQPRSALRFCSRHPVMKIGLQSFPARHKFEPRH